MKAKLIFLAGAATGFVLGSKAGRGAYDTIKAKTAETLDDPKVKKGLESASEFVQSQAPVVGHKLQDAASTVAGKVSKKAKDAKGSKSSKKDAKSDSGSSDSTSGDHAASGETGTTATGGDANGPMTPATPAP